jgi:histidyl-tRNA synthetase
MLGLMYEFKDTADRDLGLRYDLTTGLARFAASQQLPLPFKSYQIGRVWRYEAPQQGRYREFWQADIDILGVQNAKADAECLACVLEVLNELGIKAIIRINSRKLINQLAEKSRVKKQDIVKVLQIIDKLDKIGIDGVKKQLDEAIGEKSRKQLLSYLLVKGSNREIIRKLKKLCDTSDIEELLCLAEDYRIDDKLKVDLSLARGLAYYTGLIFEISIGKKQSIGGGGRYDNLIELLGSKPITATGISLGIDRIVDLLKEKQIRKEVSIKAYVIAISKEQRKDAIRLTSKLRKEDIATDMSLQERSLSKNLEYCSKLGIPFAIIIGERELKQKKFKLRDMETGSERLLDEKEIIRELNND